MDRLADLFHFPLAVQLGATFNVLLTIAIVWHFEPRTDRYFFSLPLWVAGVLSVNLLPVALLRVFTLGPETPHPTLATMDFFRDQHKLSDWVYLAASANMVFWICAAWMASYYNHRHAVILPLLLLALAAMTLPLWVWSFRR